jgi:pyruvate dehydrogenase E2 component (dihydrolipoamide acetyltransferase)
MCKRWDETLGDLVDVHPKGIGVGIAVDTKDGLLVPVIDQVVVRSIEEIVIESRRLITKARSGGITSTEMQGGVITLTNLGAYGIDGFTPILNYPEIAILGLGAIRTEPVFVEDATAVGGKRLEARDRMVLSLTFDHAAVDGAPAAAFLKDIVETVERA